MKNKTYDVLKWVALVALPTFVTFFLALAPLWNIPNAQAIAATITAFTTFLGALLGVSSAKYTPPTDGVLNVVSDPHVDAPAEVSAALKEEPENLPSTISLRVVKSHV